MHQAGLPVLMYAWADSPHTHRWAVGLRESGYAVSVISLGGWPVNGCPTTIYPHSGKLAYFTNLRRAVKDSKQSAPRLLHVHAASGFGLWAIASRIRPLVVSVWGSDILEFAQTTIGRMIVRATLRRADVVCATSRYLADATIAVEPSCRTRLQHVPFGVTLPAQPHPEPDGTPFRICMLKADRTLYGGFDAVQAVALLAAKGIDVTLTMLRPGPLREHYVRQAREQGTAARLTIHEQLDHNQIASFISDHHLLIMPSHQESFGVAALEASACGRAVVGTKVGGVPEVVQDGTTGLLVEPERPEALADAIAQLAANQAARNRMGEAGRAFVTQKYQWQRSLDAMNEIYRQLLHEH